ncbi:unnamed protein product [Cochlearia groenlandica]
MPGCLEMAYALWQHSSSSISGLVGLCNPGVSFVHPDGNCILFLNHVAATVLVALFIGYVIGSITLAISALVLLWIYGSFWTTLLFLFGDLVVVVLINRVYLLECDGFLSVIQLSDGWMKIWKMREYEDESWSVVDDISLRCIKGLVPGIFPICQTCEYVFLATHKQVLVYQRRSKLWKEMYSVKGGSYLPLWFSAHAFRSTIVTL